MTNLEKILTLSSKSKIISSKILLQKNIVISKLSKKTDLYIQFITVMTRRPNKQLSQYMLQDYQFLQDYEVIDSHRANKYSFIAKIRNSQQTVRFIKKKFTEEQFQRFKALHKLYKSGIVLADNMFILEECEQLYYYIIEAQIEADNPRFKTLQQYLYCENIQEQEEKNSILGKVKILIDCLHQEGQSYTGLDTRKIIIDDEKHLYLAPFDLDFQLKIDHFSRAYYPPQILDKLTKNQTQISEDEMLKWDVWSFGCICLQILAYSSPFFMTTSLSKQIKTIQKMKIDEFIQGFNQSMKNIVMNSLSLNHKIRTISIHKLQNIKQKIIDINAGYQIARAESNHVNELSSQLRQLNLQKNEQTGDSQLIFNLFSLTNINFDKQLHFTIRFGKTFHFYLDFNEDQPSKYKLNRKITIKQNFEDFIKILNEPVTIELKEDNKIGYIKINLQTLVLVHEGKRIWNQRLLGTYQTQENSPFKGAKLKISCTLHNFQPLKFEIIPQIAEKIKQSASQIISSQNTKISPKKNLEQKHVAQLNKEKEKEQPIRSILKEVNTDIKKKKAKPIMDKLPSISQIADNITFITEQFKKKLGQPVKQQDEIQIKLQKLLDIE